MGLFLASESPRRRMLLADLINEFEVEAAAVEEAAAFSAIRPDELALGNARLKADAVARRHPEDWVLGADTIVVLGNEIFGKPADLDEARSFLRRLSGRKHEVMTAVALINWSLQRRFEFVERSQVKFRELTPDDVEHYLQLVPVLDKAGAYGIQEHGEILVESIEGEMANIIGLPVKALSKYLHKAGLLPENMKQGI
jgi:septum formation protein